MPMLAQADAEPEKEKFPLLIGMLRPLSTSVTNEMLASNGYVVAMTIEVLIVVTRVKMRKLVRG